MKAEHLNESKSSLLIDRKAEEYSFHHSERRNGLREFHRWSNHYYVCG
jgi:hypothetical protein